MGGSFDADADDARLDRHHLDGNVEAGELDSFVEASREDEHEGDSFPEQRCDLMRGEQALTAESFPNAHAGR
jgi:hypothetical protein